MIKKKSSGTCRSKQRRATKNDNKEHSQIQPIAHQLKPVWSIFRRTLSASKRQAIFLICANISNDHFTVHTSTNNSLTEKTCTVLHQSLTYKRERKRRERGGGKEGERERCINTQYKCTCTSVIIIIMIQCSLVSDSTLS